MINFKYMTDGDIRAVSDNVYRVIIDKVITAIIENKHLVEHLVQNNYLTVDTVLSAVRPRLVETLKELNSKHD